MLDLDRLRAIKLFNTPPGQVFMANVVLRLDYALPRRTEIVLEGADEQLDWSQRYIFAMNHTDRFNYWPFQWQLWKQKRGFTATWVKGKYYENRLVGGFMDVMNNIPLPSRGYVLSSRFQRLTGRPPQTEEYRLLRGIVDGVVDANVSLPTDASEDVRRFVGNDVHDRFLAQFERDFDLMIGEVVRLSRRAAEIGNHLLIFPEGTRSVRLGTGRIGLAQIAQHLRMPVVPVGCNGCHRLYPGDVPFSKGGRVVYRIGAPILPDDPELAPHAVPPDILPFTRKADAYKPQYQAITDIVMARIAALLDDEHLPQAGDPDEAEQGARRFV